MSRDSVPARPHKRFETLQAARAVAALAVLLHHAGHAADKYAGPMPFVALTDMGLVGVDLFFVLSGFVILHATVGRGQSWRDYASARFRRIYLPYWPIGLAMIPFVFGIVPQLGAIRGWVASITLFPVGKTALNVAWTLQHEIVFYALVALALFSGWWRLGLAAWIAAILGLAIARIDAPVGLQPIDAEFLMGIAAWAAWRSGRVRIMLAASAGLALVAAALWTSGAAAGLDRSGPMAVAALFAALLPWLVTAERRERLSVPRWLSFLGDASYAIYLVHVLPLALLVGTLAGAGWAAAFLIILIAGLVGGVLYHLLVEQPLLTWARPKRVSTAGKG